MEPFEEPGTWWLPGRPSDPRGGTIRFDYGSDGLTLTLIGSFQPPTNGEVRQTLDSYPIIFGRTSSGRLMTLDGARSIGLQRVGYEHPTMTETIAGTELFIGAHLPEGSQTPCRQLLMSLEHLDEWALPDGGFSNYVSSEETAGGHLKHYAFNLPDAIDVEAFGAAIRIAYGFQPQDGRHSCSIQRPVSLIATFPEPLPYARTYDEIVKPLQYFLTFASSAPTQLLKQEFTVDGLERQVTESLSLPTWIETVHNGWREPKRAVQPFWEMLLPMRAMKERIGDVFQRWSVVMDQAGSAIDLLSALTLGPPLYSETRFLFAIQAIEAYSKGRFDSERKVSSQSGWPALQDRLKDLIDYGTPSALGLLRTGYTQLAVDTRNWLTHHTKKGEVKAATGDNLYWLTEETIILMQCCLLRDLGFNGVEAGKLLEGTRRAKAVFSTKQARGD